MILGPEVVAILGGKNYMDASSLIPVIASSVFMIYLYSVFIVIEMSDIIIQTQDLLPVGIVHCINSQNRTVSKADQDPILTLMRAGPSYG